LAQAFVSSVGSRTTHPYPSANYRLAPMLGSNFVLVLPHWSWADFYQTLAMISVAEAFDKTWFVALLMAMRFDRTAVFVGSCLALAAHTVIAAAIGYTISRVVTVTLLHFSAAALYAVLAVLFAIEYHQSAADSDLIEAGRSEAGEAVAKQVGGAAPGPGGSVVNETYGAMAPAGRSLQRDLAKFYSPMMRTFVAVFVAEWGDRTQIAMIGQHASQLLMPVVCGSLVAFFCLTFSAVIVARVLGDRKLSEKTVRAISALSFALFAVLALYDGFESRRQQAAAPLLPKAA